MTPKVDLAAIEQVFARLPQHYPGPGGVAGVMVDGRIVARAAWGYADLDSRDPMTAETRLPICSISKQFTCAAMLAACPDLSVLEPGIRAALPNFTGELPGVLDLCHNQSGLRDYWALTVLHGGKAEGAFLRDDAARIMAPMRSGHFAPGTRYSYCNVNYRLLSDLIEEATGIPLDQLYRRHIFDPAGMKTATLTADTRRPEDGVTGYEGNDASGYFPALNGITWTGDAGISASLDDMLAYEGWIDTTRADADSLYRRIAAPQTFRDGTPAEYGFGLRHSTIAGLAVTSHGGALRGFRCHRMNSRDARLSVVVMFNHHGDAHGAALRLMRAGLGETEPTATQIADDWAGQWIGAETGLFTRIEPTRQGATLHFGTGSEGLRAEGATLVSTLARITRDGDALVMQRPQENLTERLLPVTAEPFADPAPLAGCYTSDELGGAEMRIEARDGAGYVWFRGALGEGRVELMRPAAPDLWLIVTRRSMDAPAPGDWTLQLHRDATGAVSGATLGCWLARGIRYDKQP
ncbi:D-aminopeptidase [Gemmobacter serpentinus]|uniref:D-aminopeptidase n=1 Tax=Gemmobacter serpentinus TaxID=2652247 RepID=UPI00124F35AA|nr:D-aminopeptidase [Gemmobacter serpentinus]